MSAEVVQHQNMPVRLALSACTFGCSPCGLGDGTSARFMLFVIRNVHVVMVVSKKHPLNPEEIPLRISLQFLGFCKEDFIEFRHILHERPLRIQCNQGSVIRKSKNCKIQLK